MDQGTSFEYIEASMAPPPSSMSTPNRLCEMKDANAGMAWGSGTPHGVQTIKNGANCAYRGLEWTAARRTRLVIHKGFAESSAICRQSFVYHTKALVRLAATMEARREACLQNEVQTARAFDPEICQTSSEAGT